ncbi:related to Protein PET18 [Saccharomycodes ludwigii]|uniref:Related to Protein PET18 n=1 Tax=Saccharomycodes ludwigii TaxID=36035 RepID=A0A376BAP6_9ASCO|nr:hypothetical protein SCDLUD_002237 [Saccharomycodes ludwigii]KAH3902415.1 hypothetical protein SCDLUD_002237 [Saccharomycodes ludwigii]SSD61753.1 related to Protein PET18 [Saccharomycodes ludwigii]
MSVTDKLIKKYQEKFDKTINHPLTKELCNGTLPDKTLYIYLEQDLKFFHVGLRTILKTTMLAPENDVMMRLAKQVGFLANAEHGYFEQVLKLLESSIDTKNTKIPEVLPEVGVYLDFLKNLTTDHSITYEQLITFLWCSEFCYLRWAQIAEEQKLIPSDLHWKYKEWINLHSGEHFEEWTYFLQAQVDKINVSKNFADIEKIFEQTIDLEYKFFESCYTFKF